MLVLKIEFTFLQPYLSREDQDRNFRIWGNIQTAPFIAWKTVEIFMSRRKHTPLCHQQHSPFLACSILEPREHESGIIFVEHALLVVRKQPCAVAWYSGLSYDYRFIGNKRDIVLKKKTV